MIVRSPGRLTVGSEDVVPGPKAKFLAAKLTRAADLLGVASLSASQIGVRRRMFFCHHRAVSGDTDGWTEPMGKRGVVCNAVVVDQSDQIAVAFERCSSFPPQIVEVERPTWATIEWVDVEGSAHSATLSGELLRYWLHEIDHGDGVIITSKPSPGTEVIKLWK